MKRNENLKTLSWEHHDGLVISFRLKQGLSKKSEIRDMAEYILFTWKHVLSHHFWQEEQVITRDLIKDNTSIIKMYDEHEQFRRLITYLENSQSDKKLIKDFADLLNYHIRFEERTLFPFIEKSLKDEKLTEIGNFLKKNHKADCPLWKNEFWKN